MTHATLDESEVVMEKAKAKGEYRCMTPQEIGSTVVMFRKMMDLETAHAGVRSRGH